MTTVSPAEGLTLARVRVHASGDDAVAEQTGAARLLRAASVRPSGVPPGAILLVRSLRDPLPGVLRLNGATLPPAHWEQAVANRIDEVARSAARPAREVIVGDVDAVFFRDRAELLVALARDLSRGIAPQRWWWRLLVRARGLPPSLDEVFLEAPEHLPSALERLSATSEAACVLRELLTDSGAQKLLAAVRSKFALVNATKPAWTHATNSAPTTPFERPSARGLPRPQRAPWAEDAPEVAEMMLSPVKEELLGTALVLCRRPSYARSAEFARALVSWAAAPERLPSPLAAGVASARGSPAVASASGTGPARVRSAAKRPPDTRPEVGTDARVAPPIAPYVPPKLENDHGVSNELVAYEQAAVPIEPISLPEAEPVALESAPVSTGLGGVFYLLNVALSLELYSDFSAPAAPRLALDPWDFVTLLGGYLATPARAEDPVWALLTELAGRDEGVPPGAGFRPPRTWRLPTAWGVPFGDGRPLAWRSGGGRLVLRHAAGFRVVDMRRRGALEVQLERELRRLKAPAAVEGGPLPGHASDPLERWVAWIGEYLRVRIGKSLAVRGRRALSRRLLEHQARVRVSTARVDVVLSLDELPIQIRLAGLDRTPGWIPAARRHLAFHFE